MGKNSRRSFLKNSILALAGTGLASTFPIEGYGSNPPSDRLNIGVIGVGFGMSNMRHMLDGDTNIHCVALCDVDRQKLETQAGSLQKDYPDQTQNLTLYSDFRELLENQGVDGVIIATPDHWHTYIFAEACKAGKAIYVEKPTGKTVADCELMVELQQKHQNVVTTGLWQISVDYFRDAFDILKSGVLGDVYKAHAWITPNTEPVIYDNSSQPVPEGLDYEMWIGPAPMRPYNYEHVDNWRHFWDFGGGRQTDWVHYLDSAFDGMAALGHQREYPKSVYSVGYKHPETMYDVPSTQSSVFEFDDYHVIWEQQAGNLYNRGDGVAWIGSNGTLVCNRTGYEVFPQTEDGTPVIAERKLQGSYANQHNHMANWAECIRTNNTKTNSPISKGSYASLIANLANVSYRTGSQRLEYLPDQQKFRNNPEADKLIHPEYHHGWEYPEV